MISEKQPSPWRINRTTLLRKEGKSGEKAENYRPITMSSVLSRLYWGIVDQKLRRVVTFTHRQKGFVAENGCYNNVHILNELLRHSKRNEGMVAVLLDISKAFDTVPHQCIGEALRRKGLPELVVRLVTDSYKDVRTTIKTGSEEIEILLQRGVKQGDPLSPFIFNAVLEPLLLALENMPGYKINSETAISTLAFADDLILTASNASQAEQLLRYTEAYLSRLGMSISAPKCAAFGIKTTKDSWYVADPGMKLSSGEDIPFANADSRILYLGIAFNPWQGIDPEGVQRVLPDTLHRLGRLRLKPAQKVALLSTYLIPHYLYQLTIAVPSTRVLRQLDQELRVGVRNILHLPQCTASGLLYCGKRDGGLGFPKLEVLVKASCLKTGLKFKDSGDPVMRALWSVSGMESRLKALAHSERLNWPVSFKDVDTWKRVSKKRELAEWAALRAQGKSVESHTDDRIGYAWLYNTKLLKPCRYITALRLRTDTAGNRMALNRANPQPDLSCRKCGAEKETLGHILGLCTATKANRIRRHDEIRNFVVEEITKRDKEAAVTVEPAIRLPSGGNLKPDLVIERQGRVFVVDVTVRHEDKDGLARGRIEKLEKYSRLLPQIQERFGATSGQVLPVVVGSRGAMPRETVDALAELGVRDRRALITLSMIALRSSIELYHQFMDYDHRPRRNGRPM